jgi:hypothetical protein
MCDQSATSTSNLPKLTYSGIDEKDLKILLHAIYQDIIDEWPDASDIQHMQEYKYYCTNIEGFRPLIQNYLQRHLRRHSNLSPEKADLLQPINNSLDVRQNFNNLLLLY